MKMDPRLKAVAELDKEVCAQIKAEGRDVQLQVNLVFEKGVVPCLMPDIGSEEFGSSRRRAFIIRTMDTLLPKMREEHGSLIGCTTMCSAWVSVFKEGEDMTPTVKTRRDALFVNAEQSAMTWGTTAVEPDYKWSEWYEDMSGNLAWLLPVNRLMHKAEERLRNRSQ